MSGDMDTRRWTILSRRDWPSSTDVLAVPGAPLPQPNTDLEVITVVPEQRAVQAEKNAAEAARERDERATNDFDTIADLRREVEQLREENTAAKSLAQWLVALDEPDSTERRTVTLTQIIEQARAALSASRFNP